MMASANPSLSDRVAIVTGGAASLGKAMSQDLARRGASVVIADRDIVAARELEASIVEAGGSALALEVDVLDNAALSQLLERSVARFGHVDWLVNNAGMLAQLISQAADEGADLVTLRAIIEEASELGAQRVLSHMGLDDDHASGDLTELRQLLRAWRDAKSTAWHAAVNWLVRGALALLLVGIAVRLGATDFLK